MKPNNVLITLFQGSKSSEMKESEGQGWKHWCVRKGFCQSGKVGILRVEPLLPFSTWLFPGCKNTPINLFNRKSLQIEVNDTNLLIWSLMSEHISAKCYNSYVTNFTFRPPPTELQTPKPKPKKEKPLYTKFGKLVSRPPRRPR